MRVGAITPTRGERPEFLAHCKKFVARQTLQPSHHFVIDHPPEHPKKIDVGLRVKIGLQRAREAGCEVVAFFDDDDWYAPTYLEQQIGAWENGRKPMLWGIGESISYHVGTRKFFRRHHKARTLLGGTLIRTDVLDARIRQWDEIWVCIKLWDRFGRPEFLSPGPAERLMIGIKHGIGRCISRDHQRRASGRDDAVGSWLRSVVGDEDYAFYARFYGPGKPFDKPQPSRISARVR